LRVIEAPIAMMPNTEQRKRHVQSPMASGRPSIGGGPARQSSEKPGSEKQGMAHTSSSHQQQQQPKKKKKKHARKRSGTCLS